MIPVGNLACVSSGCGVIIQTEQVSFSTNYEICQVILVLFTVILFLEDSVTPYTPPSFY